MDDQQISGLADSIESSSGDLARAKMHVVQGTASHVFITANRAGFLRLAAACLHAATSSIPGDESRSKPLSLEGTVEQVGTGQADRFLGFLQRLESWPEPQAIIEQRKRRARKNDRWALLGCSLFAIIFLAFFAIGVGVTFTTLLGG